MIYDDRPITKIALTYDLKDCSCCPKVKTERTMGAGYALDYICTMTGKKTSEYVEWDSDMDPVPDDCPLRV